MMLTSRSIDVDITIYRYIHSWIAWEARTRDNWIIKLQLLEGRDQNMGVKMNISLAPSLQREDKKMFCVTPHKSFSRSHQAKYWFPYAFIEPKVIGMITTRLILKSYTITLMMQIGPRNSVVECEIAILVILKPRVRTTPRTSIECVHSLLVYFFFSYETKIFVAFDIVYNHFHCVNGSA